MFCTVNDSLPTPKSPKFYDYYVSLIRSFFFASHRRSQVYYAQPLDPRHWSLISAACHAYCIYCHRLLLLERVEFIVLNLSLWDRSYLSCAKFVIHFSRVIITTLQLLNVLVEVEFKVISLFWSTTSVSLVHRNLLREYCSLVDWRIPKGMHHQPPSGLPHLV